MQHLTHVNYLSVFLAGLAGFMFGGVYYTLLSKPWMAAHSIEHDEAKMKAMSAWEKSSPMVYCFLGQMLMAFMFYGVLSHMPKFNVANGLISGLLLWLGFVVPTLLVNYNFIGKPRMAKIIDSTNWLVVLLIIGAVLGYFGK